VIYVDSNVAMYLVGVDHPNKSRVQELMARLVASRERLVTSAEAFQEILHRYRAMGRRERLGAAYDALEVIAPEVLDVTKEDVDRARSLAFEYPGLSARDCLHLAVMRRVNCARIWSHDRGFDAVPSIQRIE
jgi:predicted nucleic acid-binding protein